MTLIRNPNALKPLDCLEAMSPAGRHVCQSAWFEFYRNGVLDHVVNGSEGAARNRMSILYNLHPDDSWDYVPTRHRHGVAAE